MSELHQIEANASRRLRAAGLRPTRQRLAMMRLLFGGGDRHVSAEDIYSEAQAAGLPLSLATVYNTLHQFTAVGLLHEVTVETGRSLFDTNASDHHHFYNETTGRLIDIPDQGIAVAGLPPVPAGLKLRRVDIIVRVADD